MTADAARGLSGSDIGNLISISQPGVSGVGNVTIYSQQFIVQSSWIGQFLETAESRTYEVRILTSANLSKKPVLLFLFRC